MKRNNTIQRFLHNLHNFMGNKSSGFLSEPKEYDTGKCLIQSIFTGTVLPVERAIDTARKVKS